jgi:hypothetical protein
MTKKKTEPAKYLLSEYDGDGTIMTASGIKDYLTSMELDGVSTNEWKIYKLGDEVEFTVDIIVRFIE